MGENFIIPSNVSFLDIEMNNIEGKFGKLMEQKQDEQDSKIDVLLNERIKIVDKRFYDDNKHIFPFKNWKHVSILKLK